MIFFINYKCCVQLIYIFKIYLDELFSIKIMELFENAFKSMYFHWKTAFYKSLSIFLSANAVILYETGVKHKNCLCLEFSKRQLHLMMVVLFITILKHQLRLFLDQVCRQMLFLEIICVCFCWKCLIFLSAAFLQQ